MYKLQTINTVCTKIKTELSHKPAVSRICILALYVN